MQLLAFLGLIRGYQPVYYVFKEQRCLTRFSTVAACHFLQPDELVVFLTDQVKEETFPEFKKALPPNIPIRPVDIPIGENETQLWGLFSSITQQVQPGSPVAFDITNGLRLFPVMGLLAAAYLQASRSISLQAVLYGAFDVGKDGTVPMFDLSPMVSLFDWTLAAERFTQFGDSEQLAKMLSSEKTNLAKAADGDKERLTELSAIGRLASTMQNISQALDLIRPLDVFEQATALDRQVSEARTLLERTPKTQPFAFLLDQIQESYQPLSGEREPLQILLKKQYHLVKWYLAHKYWVHTITLARELMVNWFLYQSGEEDWWIKSKRKEIEKQINRDAYLLRQSKGNNRTFMPDHFPTYENIEAILDTWNRLTHIRNDIDHAGHRKHPVGAGKLMTNIRKVVDQIDQVLDL